MKTLAYIWFFGILTAVGWNVLVVLLVEVGR